MEIGRVLRSATMGMPSLFTGGQPGFRAGDDRLAWFRAELNGASRLSVRSPAFDDGSEIPSKYSADGENISPPLVWSDVPQATGSLALIVEDPDAPTPEPFVHWLLYNIPPEVRQVQENVPRELVVAINGGSAMQGKNSSLKIGWTGMAPPKGDTPHHYHFQLFALDRLLSLEAGAGRKALLDAMAGHVLAKGQITGTYQR